MSEKNKDLVRRLRAASDARDEESVDRLVAPAFRAHVAGMPDADKATWKRNVAMFYSAFSGLNGPINDLVAEADRVAMRITFAGTHSGEFLGVPATGKPVTFQMFAVMRVAGGQVVEEWGCIDLASLMQQIGRP